MSDHVSFDTSRSAFNDSVSGAEPAVVRVAAELPSDVTPMTAYAALSDRSDHTFLLESGEKVASSDPAGAFTPDTEAGRHARFSFVGYDPEAIVRLFPDRTTVDRRGPAGEYVAIDETGDTLDRLRTAMPDVTRVGFPETDRQTLDGGLVGFLGYDAVYELSLNEVGVDRPAAAGETPDAEFLLTTRTVAFDELTDTVQLVFTPIVGGDDDAGAVYDGLRAEAESVADQLAAAEPPEPDGVRTVAQTAGSREAYERAVRQTKTHVQDGDIYQGVISRSRQVAGDVDPLGLYESLRSINPSPYMYLLSHGDRSVVGASPETLVSVQGERVVVNPVAGTCPRGDSPVDDRRLAGEMLADPKERAEHTMLVDLARNDARRVSDPGSVRVEEFMNVLKYSHVQHIESTVTGQLAPESDAFDATRATFPRGTLTGAPKIRAMEIIDSLEATPRDVYGGGLGYFSWTGDADLAIVIRTATVEHDRAADELAVPPERLPDSEATYDQLTVRAGAGIVADSDPAAEYEETEQKMRGVLDAVDDARPESATDTLSGSAGDGQDDSAADATDDSSTDSAADATDEQLAVREEDR